MNNVYIAPSVLSADFTRLAHELESIKSADYIHYDVMDGHFVPNISFGPAIMKEVQKATQMPFDVHLMVTNPAEIIPAILESLRLLIEQERAVLAAADEAGDTVTTDLISGLLDEQEKSVWMIASLEA